MSDRTSRNTAPIERVREHTYRQLVNREKPHYDGKANSDWKDKKRSQHAQTVAIAKALIDSANK